MSSSDSRAQSTDPDQTSAVALAPGAQGPVVGEITIGPLAPPRTPVPAPALPNRASEILLTSVVLLFAFLAASTAVRNSDFWLHLAAGRLLANREYHFGADPFFYTSADAYWTNHAWLFDLALYATYQNFGGLVLVLMKALAITALAWLMLQVRRPGMAIDLPAACTLLALLTMSPHLLMQPACVSLLLLGITFYSLWRPHAGLLVNQKPEIQNPKTEFAYQSSGFEFRHGLLLLVFALWANLDEWFFLGPMLAALFWIGERLDSAGSRPTPGWLVPAGFAACLVNPHLYRVFTSLPPELTPGIWASELRGDSRFQGWFQRPWRLDYFEPSAGLNAAGLAYFALVALGLVSFVLYLRTAPAAARPATATSGSGEPSRTGYRHLRGWRLLVWFTFALLGAWQVRTIAFFAVIAGPITALNLQDAAAGLAEIRNPKSEVRNGRRLVRISDLLLRIWPAAVLVSGLALAMLAWPGWLQAVPHEHHRVAWKVQANPSLQRVAETLHRWRQEGLLSEEERIFPAHPDIANYCAWFAPGEKAFLDFRSPHFSRLASRYEAVCRAVGIGRGANPSYDWREVLRDYGISVVVLYDADEQRLLSALHRLAPATDDWDLLRVDGRALIVGWNGARADGAFGRLSLDSRRLAFGPVDGDLALPPAPAVGPQRPPRRPEWWQRLLTAAPAPGWQTDAATMYLSYYEKRAGVEQRHAGAAYAAAVVGVAAPGSPAAFEQVSLRLRVDEPFLPGYRSLGTDLLLLAVRAARLALADNPDDKIAWLRLGQAYYALRDSTDEQSDSGRCALLGSLRHVQIATALENAVALDPDLEQAHKGLSVLYGERMFLDAALEHRRHVFRLTRRGRHAGETERELRDRVKAEETAVRQLEQVVQDRKNDYAIRSRAMSGDPLGRAQLALSLGLARVALDDVLLQSPVQTFGGEGARLELELLLQFGRAELVREMLTDPAMRENKELLEFSSLPAPARPGYLPLYRLGAYEWLSFLQAAASGDYAVAIEELEELIQPLAESARRARGQMRLDLPVALAHELGLGADPTLLLPRILMERERLVFMQYLTEVSFQSAQRADLHVLGGLLATERGSPAAALQAFDAAFAAAAKRIPQGDFAAAPLAAAYRRWLQAARENPKSEIRNPN
jgi:hypothetical protein